MSPQDLGSFWQQNKQRIGAALPGGTDALAAVLQASADDFGLVQQIDDSFIRWVIPEGAVALMFCVVPDPRDLDRILEVYEAVRQREVRLTAVFVNQRTDGPHEWDVFVINAQCAMRHADRISGVGEATSDLTSEPVSEPHDPDATIRKDIYSLFDGDQEFPLPGNAAWARLLAGPTETVHELLAALAAACDCVQVIDDGAVCWNDTDGAPQAMFFLLPDRSDLDTFIGIYRWLRETGCRVAFVFLDGDRAGLYDIFRLSARSYLKHHNQAKAWADGKTEVEGMTGTPQRELPKLRWQPHWASHVGCLEGCLDSLGCDVSTAWLFGATGHAFVLNIVPDLCPSGPTDWDTSGMLRLLANFGYRVELVDEYSARQDDLEQAQARVRQLVTESIDAGWPCYGWELDIPEYQVIFGYDEQGVYISGPTCDDGKGPMPWTDIGRSEIGMVLVASVRPIADAGGTAGDAKIIHDALTYALDLAHNRIKWTGAAGGLAGYTTWIDALERGTADRFGLGYNAAVWSESRRFAVEFLEEARGRLAGVGPENDGDIAPLLADASQHYSVVAAKLKAVAQCYPFDFPEDETMAVDDRAREAVAALREAREAEVKGLQVFAELVELIGR